MMSLFDECFSFSEQEMKSKAADVLSPNVRQFHSSGHLPICKRKKLLRKRG